MNLITRTEAQKITGYSKCHFQRLINAGRVPKPVARYGRSYMYDRCAIELFAATKKPTAG